MSVPRASLLGLAAALTPACAAPAARESLEDRMHEVRAALGAARDEGIDLATAARRLREARDATFRLQVEVTDPALRRELGIEDLAIRVETERREILQGRLPEEAYRRFRSAVAAEAMGTFGAARQFVFRRAQVGLFDALARDLLPEGDSEELERLLAADPATLTEADRERAKRLAHERKEVRFDLEEHWTDRSKAPFRVTSYGSGTFLVADSRGDREDAGEGWWGAASAEERAEWLLTLFAERCGCFEVLRTWDDPCSSCRSGSTEAVAAASCPACHGCGVVRRVRWR